MTAYPESEDVSGEGGTFQFFPATHQKAQEGLEVTGCMVESFQMEGCILLNILSSWTPSLKSKEEKTLQSQLILHHILARANVLEKKITEREERKQITPPRVVKNLLVSEKYSSLVVSDPLLRTKDQSLLDPAPVPPDKAAELDRIHQSLPEVSQKVVGRCDYCCG